MINWTILKLIEWTTEYFTKAGIPNPRLDAELLLAHTINKKRIELYLSFDQIVGEKELATFKGFIQRRAKREPLQYIICVQDFCGVQIKVTPDVLIPRPETEILVEKVLKLMTPPPLPSPLEGEGEGGGARTILDLCTGSGAIIAALANKLPEARFVGTDISEAALAVAKENIEKWRNRIKLLCGDLFEPMICHSEAKGRRISRNQLNSGDPSPPPADQDDTYFFDIIISNPPYIPEGEWASLQTEIRDFEPKEALLAENDGLAIIRKIINDAYKFLKPGGWLIMEIGDGQTDSVKKLILDAGHYNEPEFVKDYGGVERIVIVKSSMSS